MDAKETLKVYFGYDSYKPGQEIIVKKNGREVGRFIPKDAAVSYLTDSLTGILKGNYDLDEAKAERLKEKYEAID